MAQVILPEVLTPAEVASLFGVDAKTVTRWANAGKLNCFRTLGGHRRFNSVEVMAKLKEMSHVDDSSISG